jgi:hypothetical protein
MTRDRVSMFVELEERTAPVREALKPPPVRVAPSTDRLGRPASRREVVDGRLPKRWAWGTLASWGVIVGTIFATEPAPANPDAPDPWWGVLLVTMVLLTLPVALVGLARRKTWSMHWSLASAVPSLGLAIACFATGHHAGLYPYGEAAAFGYLTWLSWKGLTLVRASPERGPAYG